MISSAVTFLEIGSRPSLLAFLAAAPCAMFSVWNRAPKAWRSRLENPDKFARLDKLVLQAHACSRFNARVRHVPDGALLKFIKVHWSGRFVGLHVYSVQGFKKPRTEFER